MEKEFNLSKKVLKKESIEGYVKTCPICKKVITSLSEKQLMWNYYIHLRSCSKEHKLNKQEV